MEKENAKVVNFTLCVFYHDKIKRKKKEEKNPTAT